MLVREDEFDRRVTDPELRAARERAEPEEVQDLSLTRFAQLLALTVLGLAGLLSLGVGGVVLVQGYAFPAPPIGVREPGPGRLRFPNVVPHQSSEGALEASRAIPERGTP